MKLIDRQDVRDSLERIAAALSDWKWCLIGGRAVEVRSNPPQTPDIDCLVNVNPSDKEALVDAIKEGGFSLDTRLDDAEDEEEFPMLFFKDNQNGVEVDVAGAFDDIHFWTIDRATTESIGGTDVYVATAEDIVILKAQAALSRGSKGKSKRDKLAIKAIAEACSLDTAYIDTVLEQASADMTDERRLLVKLGVIEE